MSRRPPPTSYGYLVPRGARLRGWECNNDECGTGDQPAPRSWPYPCPRCGRPTDATFHEPWAHEARGYEIRHRLANPDRYGIATAQAEHCVWAYKDAGLRGDRAAADRAWRAYRAVRPAQWREETWWIGSSTMYQMVSLAAGLDEIDLAVGELMEYYPFIDTRDVENNNARRTTARSFISMCITVLERTAAIDHPREAELYAAMRDIADRIEGVLMDHHHRGLQRIGEARAFHRARAAIAETRRSSAAVFDGLPQLRWAPSRGGKPRPPAAGNPRGLVGARGLNPWLALQHADAAIDTAEVHDDTGPLADLVDRLDTAATYPGLTRLVRARLHLVTGDLPAAARELELAAGATDHLARRLRPQILATHGVLIARTEPGRLDEGIELCRRGRRAGLRWWRRTTPADAGLARLLLWRALASPVPPGHREDVREAVRLIRRRCRLWHLHGADDRLLRQEAFAARDRLAGRPGTQRRHRAWRYSVAAPWSVAARARTAAAWAEWAVGTGVPEFAAEAYQHLVALVSQDAIARSGTRAKERVLAAAQDYAEEAGYWLARTGRYREAVLVLEMSRAVGLTEVLIHNNITGTDPLALEVNYADITAETGDGALVYLAAAKAGGYALVVAATHDPQYFNLPKLDRASVAEIMAKVLPESEPSTGFARLASTAARDLTAVRPPGSDPMAEGLRALWNGGLKDLVLLSARGRVVTLIPVGLPNMLPLHAAGTPGAPTHEYTGWQHAGHFSAIRYAPNARVLRRCRDTVRELAGREQTLLAVHVPDGYGIQPGGHLRYAARETAEVTQRWPGHWVRTTHSGTWEEFRAAADEHTVWHLACHGSAEPGSILGSRLYFADRQVTLEELRRSLKPSRRRLAVLSACRTNLAGSTMPNEVVGLPTVLLQVGFAGVIATAWAVDDLATTYLMTVFYERWCLHGDEPAIALNRAQQWLRGATRADLAALLPDVDPAGGPDEHPYVDPRYWAPFAYTGA